MSGADDGDRPATAAELADLRSALASVQEAQEELRSATTEREQREARKDVGDAQADLDAVARSLGISREALDKATKAAKDSERRDELKPILRDLIAELRDEEAQAEAKRKEDEAAKKKAKPRPDDDKPKPDDKAKAKSDGDDDAGDDGGEPPVDDGPTGGTHWSEKSLFGKVSS